MGGKNHGFLPKSGVFFPEVSFFLRHAPLLDKLHIGLFKVGLRCFPWNKMIAGKMLEDEFPGCVFARQYFEPISAEPISEPNVAMV